MTSTRLRHPTEPSRFALALTACGLVLSAAVFVMLALGQVAQLLSLLLSFAGLLAIVWLLLQVWRIRLLADAVLVTEDTLPELQAVMNEIRERLGYRRRLDLFVVNKISKERSPVALTNFFGVKVLIVEGDIVSDLANPEERNQLVFLLATYVGALKARHTRWYQWLSVLQITGIPRVASLFVNPWLRSTVYSGDRIAYACCGDLDVSLRAVYRMLVGKGLAPHVKAEGLAEQALAVRRRPLLRLAQVLQPVPHTTNRYLELLAFVQGTDTFARNGVRPNLGGLSTDVLAALARLRRRRPSRGAVPVAAFFLVVMLVASIGIGVEAQTSEFSQVMASLLNGPEQEGPTPLPTGTSADTTTPSTPIPAELLAALVPTDMRRTCIELSTGSDANLFAAVACRAVTVAGPMLVVDNAYESTAALDTAFTAIVGDLPHRDCLSGRTYLQGYWRQGPLACYVITTGRTVMVRGYTDLAVLAWATGPPALSTPDMLEWWQSHAELAR